MVYTPRWFVRIALFFVFGIGFLMQANIQEVKGYYLGNSKERIAMFRERYKQVKLIIIDKDEYNKMLSESDYFRRYAF